MPLQSVCVYVDSALLQGRSPALVRVVLRHLADCHHVTLFTQR